MNYPINEHIRTVHFPPISEVRGWLASRPADGLELIDLCQAVPDYAPPAELTAHLATLLDDPQTSKYSPDEPEPLNRIASISFPERASRAPRILLMRIEPFGFFQGL